jgi:small subunit ribosomal protein S19
MTKKEFTFRGKSVDDIKKMTLKEFAELLPARQRRSLKRGLDDLQKDFLQHIKKGKKNLETHARNMIILPEMLDKTIRVHNGKGFSDIIIQPEMLGHYLGEFALTRKKVTHSAPGIGATRSSASLSVK